MKHFRKLTGPVCSDSTGVDRDLRIYHKRQSGENTELYIDEFCEDQ